MIIDCHVHISAFTPGHGHMSDRLMNSIAFRYMRWKFGLAGKDAGTERGLEAKLADVLEGTPEIDAAVILAFDGVHDGDGSLDHANTHLHVTNDYVIELCRRNRKMLFGASVHPYRKDAVAEVERCVKAGAVLMKWLPLTQDIDPSDPRCFPVYEAMAHHGLPLLSHTGWEAALPVRNPRVADPMLLAPALARGVKVIAAHCGTRAIYGQRDYLPEFLRLARDYEHAYGDTSALSLPTRSHAYAAVMEDDVVRNKLVHGSDWPILPIPPGALLGWASAAELLMEDNWLRRDVLVKRRLGFDKDYWERAGKVLRIAG